MKQFPDSFGSSLGSTKPLAPEEKVLDLSNSGLDFSRMPDAIEDGLSPESSGYKFTKGGITPDHGLTDSAITVVGAAADAIRHMGSFNTENGTKRIIQIDSDQLYSTRLQAGLPAPDAIGGLFPVASEAYNTVVIQDHLIMASAKNQLRSWDGVIANPTVVNSADSPQAPYLIKLGNRLVAAGAQLPAGTDSTKVFWSADGIITDWTTANLGAGSVVLEAEGLGQAGGPIMGLGVVEGAGVILRRLGLVLMQPTGIGAAPFRFTTVDQAMGTESPYSIASGGMKPGIFYVGTDMVAYHFDGRSLPTPIGAPISDHLQEAFGSSDFLGLDASSIQGAVDYVHQEYWFMAKVRAGTEYKHAFIFDIKEWVKTGRLTWRHRWLDNAHTTFGKVSAIAFTLREVAAGNLAPDSTMMFSILTAANFRARYYLDYNTYILNTDGLYWDSKQFGDPWQEATLDKVRVWGYGHSLSVAIVVALTWEVGAGAGASATVTLPRSGTALGIPLIPGEVTVPFYKTGRMFQIRISAVEGRPHTITKIAYTIIPRGRGRD